MYKDHKVAVVVPCYNEETQIGKVVETMPDYIDHIVIIDDQSSDKTVEVVKALSAEHPRIVLIEHEENQGVGGAIASGYKWARDNDMDAAVVMAGDAQMDPIDLPRLLDPVVEEGVDYTKGNRLIHAESYDLVPKVRFFGNAALSMLTKIASGYWHIADSQCGYTVIGKDALKIINWDKMYKRYGQPNDLLISLNIDNFTVRDISSRPVYGVGEQSKMNIKKVLITVPQLLFKGFLRRLFWKYVVRDFHPLVLFYCLSMLSAALSTFFFIRVIWLWIANGSAPEVSLLTLFFLLMATLQSAFFAMWMDMEANRSLR